MVVDESLSIKWVEETIKALQTEEKNSQEMIDSFYQSCADKLKSDKAGDEGLAVAWLYCYQGNIEVGDQGYLSKMFQGREVDTEVIIYCSCAKFNEDSMREVMENSEVDGQPKKQCPNTRALMTTLKVIPNVIGKEKLVAIKIQNANPAAFVCFNHVCYT